jgi:hypothetical protein
MCLSYPELIIDLVLVDRFPVRDVDLAPVAGPRPTR